MGIVGRRIVTDMSETPIVSLFQRETNLKRIWDHLEDVFRFDDGEAYDVDLVDYHSQEQQHGISFLRPHVLSF